MKTKTQYTVIWALLFILTGFLTCAIVLTLKISKAPNQRRIMRVVTSQYLDKDTFYIEEMEISESEYLKHIKE